MPPYSRGVFFFFRARAVVVAEGRLEVRSGQVSFSTHTRWWGKGECSAALATPRLDDRSPTALEVQGPVRVWVSGVWEREEERRGEERRGEERREERERERERERGESVCAKTRLHPRHRRVVDAPPRLRDMSRTCPGRVLDRTSMLDAPPRQEGQQAGAACRGTREGEEDLGR